MIGPALVALVCWARDRPPLWAALPTLRALAALIRPEDSAFRALARLLGQEGAAVRDWEARAFWANEANRAIRSRLDDGRAHEVIARRLPIDWSRLDAALDRGATILASAHVGPGLVAAHAVAEHYRKSAFLFRKQHAALEGRRLLLTRDDKDKQLSLAWGLDALREGPLFLAADRGFGSRTERLPFLGLKLRWSLAPAVLARLSRARTLPLHASWEGSRFRVEIGEPLVAAAGSNPDTAWQRAYLEWLAPKLQPEAFRLHGGGIWELLKRAVLAQ